MMLRHNQHRQEVRDKSTPLGKHFDSCGYEKLSLQIITCVKEGDTEALERAEGFWQNNLATVVEHGGINTRDELIYKGRRKTSFLSVN